MTNTLQPTKQCPGCGATTRSGYCDPCLDAPKETTMANTAFAAAEARHLAEPEPRCEDCLEAEPTAPDGLCDDCAADRQAERDDAELAKDLP